GTPKRLAGNSGADEAPVWSHKGDRIAFVGALRANDAYQTNRVMVVPVEGGPACDLTASLDNWVASDNYALGSGRLARPLCAPDARGLGGGGRASSGPLRAQGRDVDRGAPGRRRRAEGDPRRRQALRPRAPHADAALLHPLDDDDLRRGVDVGHRRVRRARDP